MFRSFRIGRAFGIPLYLHPTFLLLPLWALYLSRNDGLIPILFTQVLVLATFGCVLLHELGHALMARYFSIPTRDITLYPIGGVARLESTGNQPVEEIFIALAGPAVNLFIVLFLSPIVVVSLLGGLLRQPGPGLVPADARPLEIAATFIMALWMTNGVLLLFNLVPAFPMDGGRVLRAILALGVGQLRATEIATVVGIVVASGMAIGGILGGFPTLALVAVFVFFAAQQELGALRRQEALRREERQEVLEELVIPTRLTGFTGLVWDRDNRVWVRWVDGRPVQTM